MKVALLGYGKTTRALAKRVEHCVFFDDKTQEMYIDEEGFMVAPSFSYDPTAFDVTIPSPGIPPYNPMIQNAQHLISEYDFFAESMGHSVWISGTNGKTTTTQMITHILANIGAQSGGNIGEPVAMLDPKRYWVLETSSFTLHYTTKAKPNIYVLLPIREDHISWHGSFKGYVEDKLKPLGMMQEGDVAIVPKEYASIKSEAMVIGYEDANELAELFDIETKKLRFRGGFLLDSVLALCVQKILTDRIDYEAMNAFVVDPHRQEEFVDSKGYLWVNDTKATNIDATLACLDAYAGKNIHLILGGDDKGVSLEPLFNYLKGKPIITYHIGANEKRLSAMAKRYDVAFEECSTLENAVAKIKEKLQKDEVAILSPAAASLDQFSSYAHRGEAFKKAVLG